jgi:hypothetical protein
LQESLPQNVSLYNLRGEIRLLERLNHAPLAQQTTSLIAAQFQRINYFTVQA